MSRAFKIILSVFVVGLTIAAALWIVGGKKTRYSTSLVIDAPPAKVFDYLTDAELLKKWVEGLVSIDSTNDLTNQVGAQARVIMEMHGKQMTFDDEVIRYEDDALLSVKTTSRLVTLISIFRLEPKDDDKTSLTLVVKKANRGLGKFIGPFMGSPIEEQIKSDAQRLKEVVESEWNAAKPQNGTAMKETSPQESATSSTPDGG